MCGESEALMLMLDRLVRDVFFSVPCLKCGLVHSLPDILNYAIKTINETVPTAENSGSITSHSSSAILMYLDFMNVNLKDVIISSDQTVATVRFEWAGESASIDLDNQESLRNTGLSVKQYFAIICATNGNLDILKTLISLGIDPNACTMKKSTALHVAIKNEQLKVIDYLLEIGARTDIESTSYGLPTHFALKQGKYMSLNLLLKAGANRESVDSDGKTILARAIETNDLSAMAVLCQFYPPTVLDLNKIIDNVTEADDSLAMSTLIRLNLVNACKYFGVTFKYTANTRKIFGDLYQRFKFSDHEKIFAFYYAIKAGRMDNVQLLKSSGFDLNKIKDQGTGILEYAIRYEDEFVVQKLLQMGVKPTEKTEIDKIVIETIKASNINILKLIFGAGLNSFKSMDYDNIRKLLVFACKIGNLSIIEELFGHAGSLSEGQRLEIAHLSKNDEIFMNFLNRGFVNRLGNGTINWFMHEILVEGDRPKLMKAIAESGANIYEENMVYNIYSGMLRANSALERRLTPSDSPSVTALIHSRNKSMEVFLEQGFNPNHRIFSGTSTLLHLACELKNVEIAKLLIKYGADTNALDKNNRTPFSYIDNSEMLAKLQDMSEFL